MYPKPKHIRYRSLHFLFIITFVLLLKKHCSEVNKHEIKIFERHTILTGMLTRLGVDPETAAEDACKMEHVISDESMAALKKFIES